MSMPAAEVSVEAQNFVGCQQVRARAREAS